MYIPIFVCVCVCACLFINHLYIKYLSKSQAELFYSLFAVTSKAVLFSTLILKSCSCFAKFK